MDVLDDVVNESNLLQQRSVVGFFLGYKMPYHAMKILAIQVWKILGLEDVMMMKNGFMIFHFKIEDDVYSVIKKEQWIFRGKTIVLQQWNPYFVFDKNKIKRLSV